MKFFNVFFCILIFSHVIAKESFKFALLYPVNKKGVSYIGGEAVCISEGLLKEFAHDDLAVTYKIYDTEQNKNKTIVTLQEVLKDRPDVVIGTTYSDPAIVASKFLSPQNIPFIAPTSTNPKVTQKYPLSLRLCYDDYVQASKLAEFTRHVIFPKRILVLTNLSSEFSRFLSQEYIARLKKSRFNNLTKEFKFIDASYDVSKIIKEIKQGGYDLIFSSLQASETGILYNELKKLSKKPVLLGSDSIGGRKSFFEIIKTTDDSIKFYFVRQWNKIFNGPHVNDYHAIHKKYCQGYDKTTMSVAAYDALKMALNTIQKNSKARGQVFVEEIKKYTYRGLIGDVTFKGKNTPNKKLYIYSIESNKIKFIQEI